MKTILEDNDMGKVRCPGSISSATPTPMERPCPRCGSMVEIWSDEERVECKCGGVVFKDRVPTCAEWCPAADECLGDVVDVKRIKEEARKRAGMEGDPEFVSKVRKLIKDRYKRGPMCPKDD
jgi:hypothetical protein